MSFGRTVLVFFVGAIGCVACALHTKGTCEEYGTCPLDDAGIAAGDGDAGGSVVVPPDCDLTKAINASAACVSDTVGVFVAPSGDDGASGTKATPVKSIAKGVALAASRKLPRVYVCEGTYDAPVEVTSAVSIFGGLTCAWVPSASARPKLAPPTGTPLRVSKVTSPVSFEDLDVSALADATVPGASAIAAIVSESTSVAFRRVNLTAGKALDGAKGESRSNYAGVATPGGKTTTAAAGAGPSCTCLNGTSSKGGTGADGTGAGSENGSSLPTVGSPNSGLSGQSTCVAGGPGANGSTSAQGGAAMSPGVLSSLGWDSSVLGQAGGDGSPGQGGGGGGSRTELAIGGGGGGCGGCGGAGGVAGQNGGSSFALLSFNSDVTVDAGSLSTGAAGAGGRGGNGQDGQSGGAFGVGVCNGGSGGHGGGGGGGAGGAGGHSVPVGFVGNSPNLSGTTLTPGSKGIGGSGGQAGGGAGNAGSGGVSGPDGKSENTLSL